MSYPRKRSSYETRKPACVAGRSRRTMRFIITRSTTCQPTTIRCAGCFSLRIEAAYSKDKILELYLNEIFLGLGAYGVAAASLEPPSP